MAFALAESVSHLLHRAQQYAADQFAAALGRSDLTLRQFALLAAIAERPGQTQTDLVHATGIDRSTLADMIARMEKRGLVKRESAANDKRAKAVMLTPQGRVQFQGAMPAAQQADEALLATLPKMKQQGLMAALSALAETANAKAPEEATLAPAPAPKTPARTAKAPAKPAVKTKAQTGPKPKAKAKDKDKK